ncbi:MAG: biotin/lipoyl-binding protein [Alphaproteobacteria bacterium]|jgi:biotin carboxyl carrier protein|nr:biotin/lipoyl-binding protein [Alphaproteobacteria bacterium]
MQKKLKITVDGKTYDVTVEDVGGDAGTLYPEPGMSAAAMQTPGPAAAAPAAAPAAAAGEGGDEVAPLSGVVVSVDVTVGQDVNEGDKIATLEAMKMKTNVIAHRSGKVIAVHVNAGDGIEAGEPILTIG